MEPTTPDDFEERLAAALRAEPTPDDIFVHIFANSSPCGHPTPCRLCVQDAKKILDLLHAEGVVLVDAKTLQEIIDSHERLRGAAGTMLTAINTLMGDNS